MPRRPAVSIITTSWWARIRGKGRNPCPLADNLQLLNGAGALQITRHQHRGVALLFQMAGQLTGQRRLTGTLQAGEHNHRRRVLRQVQPAGFAAENVNELLVDDLDHLLGRVERLGDLGALRTFLDALNKSPHDGQGHVGFEQGQTDLASGGVNVRFGQLALPTQPGQG